MDSSKNSYFVSHEARRPPRRPQLTELRALLWHLTAGLSVGFGAVYLHWRWSNSFAPDQPLFWSVVICAELLAFVGLILFYFDIWNEKDSDYLAPPTNGADLHLYHNQEIKVDIFIATYDEDTSVVNPSILAALSVDLPECCKLNVHLLDDGKRLEMLRLAETHNVQYHSRTDRAGFKAGNIREALLNSDGDFVVICDADTRVYSTFLTNTLGYFRDEKVSWVQTPHWFYDLPSGMPRVSCTTIFRRQPYRCGSIFEFARLVF